MIPGIGHKGSGKGIIRGGSIRSVMCPFIQPIFILAGKERIAKSSQILHSTVSPEVP